MRSRSILLAIVAGGMTLLYAQATQTGTAITPAQIARAISSPGEQVSPNQVILLSDVSASTGDPELKVLSVEPWGVHQKRVRLGCATLKECLPFFVGVNIDQYGVDGMSILRDVPMTSSRHKADRGSLAIRNGSPATLVIDDGRVHIRLRVICQEGGAIGQSIHVVDKSSKKSYMALVVNESEVRGTL